MNNSPHCVLSFGCNVKHTQSLENAKFFGIQIDNHLDWKIPSDQMNS